MGETIVTVKLLLEGQTTTDLTIKIQVTDDCASPTKVTVPTTIPMRTHYTGWTQPFSWPAWEVTGGTHCKIDYLWTAAGALASTKLDDF